MCVRSAHDLGVRYVLEGSVRRAGDRLRISAQLVECENGRHIWAEHFDGTTLDVFDFQDRITESVAALVEPHIQKAELERSRRERPGSIAAYDLYLRALPRLSMSTVEDNAEAFALLTEALVLEPDNPVFLALATWAISQRGRMAYPPISTDDRQTCAELARRGLERAAGDATVIAHCSMALLHRSSIQRTARWVISHSAKTGRAGISTRSETRQKSSVSVWVPGRVSITTRSTPRASSSSRSASSPSTVSGGERMDKASGQVGFLTASQAARSSCRANGRAGRSRHHLSV